MASRMSRIYAPSKLVDEFDRAINAELDFLLEADNAEKFARNFRDWSSRYGRSSSK